HRYLEDLSLLSLLFDGDGNPRHHVYGALGAFLIGAFVLVVIGMIVVIVHRWHEPFWRFVLFGAAASIVPGALTADQFHSLRLVAYPVFLLTLMIPGLASLLGPAEGAESPNGYRQTPLWSRRIILGILLAGMVAQTI